MSGRVGLALMIFAFVVGLWCGVYLEQRAEREREVVALERRVPTAAPPTLRCTNGAEPRAWTRVEAEARYHSASQYLRVAEEAGLWNSTGRRAALMAIGQLLEVALCWPGEEKP